MRALLLFICFFVPAVTLAHEAGLSFEVKTEEYFVDIGYDVSPLVSGERAVFDFALRDLEGNTVAFEYVWVRVLSEDSVLLATGIARPTYGATTLAYVVPAQTGTELTIEARFQDSGKTLAEAQFSLPVQKSWGASEAFVILAVIMGLLCGIFITHAGRRLTTRT